MGSRIARCGKVHEIVPVAIAGDFNVMPTDLDVYAPERWRDDALFAPEVKAAYARLLEQGWMNALRQLLDREPRSWEKTSDYAPVWIELAKKPRRRR